MDYREISAKNVDEAITKACLELGIPSDELPHVKERFYKGSSKARGSGIGLAIADEIMKLHGGRLEINSVVGEGTVATMVLPAIIGDPDAE